MALQFKTEKKLHTYINNAKKNIEQAMIYYLEYIVADLQNHAKLNAEYKDQTANLKGSIGGIVLKDGQVISGAGFNDNGQDGNQAGKEFIQTLITQNNQGYVLILVAGMEYATYVENYHGLNVLKKSELKMQSDLQEMMNVMKQKIEKMNHEN